MTILTVVVPIFAMIAIGWTARRFGLVEAPVLRGLRDVVFRFAMPALLFLAIARAPALDIVGVTVVYFAGCLFVFGLAVVTGRVSGLSMSRAAMLGLNSAYGNTVMMGIPIVAAALGPDALPPLLTIVALHSAVLLPLTGMLIDLDAADDARRRPVAILRTVVVGMARNPIIVAILLAFLWRATHLTIPAPIAESLRLLGGAATPLALIYLGGTLPPLHVRSLGRETMIGAGFKLVLLPALVWAIGAWVQLPPAPLAVAIITAGMPTGANAVLLAGRHEHLLESSAATVLVATLVSTVSISLLLWALL